MAYKVAVVGATGNVGREMLTILGERNFPVAEIYAVASEKSAGQAVSFGDQDLLVQDLAKFDFRGIDVVLSSPGSKVSAQFAPRAAAAGAVVIDNTSYFRMDPDIPLVVPEVNPEAIAGYKNKNIIANPNCSTIQMVVALKPLHDAATVKRVVVSTYQSVSGAGKEAMDELFNQTRNIFMNNVPEPKVFQKRIAFNLIPQIDDFMDDRATKEEWKMAAETKKILGGNVKVMAHCVRVPVFVGHAEMVNVEFERDMDALTARSLWLKSPGITLIDLETDMGYVTPADVQGEDSVFISRSRDDPTLENGISFWCAADNLRKGAALNAVQIAERLVRDYF